MKKFNRLRKNTYGFRSICRRCMGIYFVLINFSVDAQHEWKNVAIGGGGFVSAVIAAPNDPNVFYARTDVGGAYRWDEPGQRWIPLMDWVSADERGLLGIDGIAVDPQVAGRVYLLAGTTYWNNGKTMFLRSDDYGATWDTFDVTSQFKAHGNGMGRSSGERLAVDPNNSNVLFCGTRYDGLWKSTDRGTSWAQVTSFPVTTTANESGTAIMMFDANTALAGVTQTIYAGVSRADDNVYVSNDAGSSWALVVGRPTTAAIMPQRFALTSNGQYLYVTYGNGGGPHAMLWNGVTDYYNRGAVYKYDTQSGTWSDISPENFMLDLDKIIDDEEHYGAYSGISIDPADEDRIVVTSINSWRAPQYWNDNGTYSDSWGDNIYLSEDGGSTWREMFRYYWQDGGFIPDYEILDDNDIPWIRGSNIHWNGAIVIDPNDSERAFVCAGNGVWSTDNLLDYYTDVQWVNNSQDTIYHGKSTWKFESKGIEETVPFDVVTIPGGPMVSVIGDYDGFVHNSLDIPSPYGRLTTNVSGTAFPLGTTTGLDYAPAAGVLVKTARTRSVSTQYNTIPIGPVQWSSDNGLSWTTQTYISNPPDALSGGRVAISTDGAVTLWMPDESTTMYRYENSAWTTVSGVAFAGRAEADKVNANVFYTFDATTGTFYKSIDKGVSFTQVATLSAGTFETVRAVPGMEGHVWVPLTTGGLAKTTDGGQSFSTISGVTYCEAVGLGKAAPGSGYPTVFIFGTVGGTTGVFMSTNEGGSWTRVNDDEHEYGGLANGEFVQGDLNVFGRVYMSTAGRGIVYGEPSGTPPTNQIPVAAFTSTTQSGTVPLSVSFDASTSTDADGDNLTYSWAFGDGSSDTGVVTSHTFTTVGTYIVTLTVADGNGGIDTETMTMTANSGGVNTPPVAAFTSSTTSGTVPLGVSFDASASTDADGDNLTYSWAFGDGSSDIGVTTSHTFTVAGTYPVTLTVNDGNGGTDDETTPIVASSGGGTPCGFETPTASALPSVTTSYSAVHVLGTGGPDLSNVIQMNINWSLIHNGLWDFSVNTSDGIPAHWLDLRTVSTTLFNTAQPVVTFTSSGFSGLDGAYDVTLDGSNLVMVSQTGDFTIYFSNSTTPPACASTARHTAAETIVTKPLIVLFPNPVKSDLLTIQLPVLREGEVNLRVVSVAGKVLIDMSLGVRDRGVIQQSIDVSGLSAGSYLLHIETVEGSESFSFIRH